VRRFNPHLLGRGFGSERVCVWDCAVEIRPGLSLAWGFSLAFITPARFGLDPGTGGEARTAGGLPAAECAGRTTKPVLPRIPLIQLRLKALGPADFRMQ
jgi:hypothetical protein